MSIGYKRALGPGPTAVAASFVLACLSCAGASGAVHESAPARAPAPSPAEPGAPSVAPEAIYFVPVDNAPQRGPDDALITLVVFTDFECPFCVRARPTIDALMEQYGDKLRVVFRHFPLGFHRRAMLAHEAAQEAWAQGGNDTFWEMHDRLFDDPTHLERSALQRHAERLQMDTQRFGEALDTHRNRTLIQADIEMGRRLGVRGTPTFFLNGRRLSGARPLDEFVALADEVATVAQAELDSGTSPGRLYHALIENGLREEPVAPEPTDVLVATPPIPRYSPRRGSDDAPVVIQMFSDFECRFCAQANRTLNRVMQQYDGQVRLVFRHMPLRFHRNARAAATAAVEARAQGGDEAFWAFHDQLLENHRDLSWTRLAQIARNLQLDVDRVRRAVETDAHRGVLNADARTARVVGVRGTPTFVIGNRILRGARPFLEFEELIDEILDPELLEEAAPEPSIPTGLDS